MRCNTFKTLSLFVAMAFISGCFPAPYVYHEPSAPDGELVHSFCNQFAPKDTIEFQFEGIKIQTKGQNNGLSINIYIPEGKKAQFVSDEIEIYENKPENARTFRITRSAYYDGQPNGYVTINPTDPLIGRTKPLVKYGFAGDRLFEMSVQFDDRNKDHFYIRLPALRIGGQLYEFQIIDFTKKTGVRVGSVNC